MDVRHAVVIFPDTVATGPEISSGVALLAVSLQQTCVSGMLYQPLLEHDDLGLEFSDGIGKDRVCLVELGVVGGEMLQHCLFVGEGVV